ncbi:ImmA/IrrE family metallo-endopeptidase [Hymenobacter sp. PAMC 26628]|uniref:ImmA/IrrE family metallo-endopeptidase n=1 Tax=Hymenobacter sp. PAMC 26628 TaxID=1484118 RepID=UPI0009020715|nr:ImmA/IrrE family metallo-endopeptidase [Hymenobacter sp. PAMC 26628]
MARTLLQKQCLTPPIDVLTLIQRYADVIFRPIPIANVDGVCLDLKVAGKRPRVIVNTNTSTRRRLFTLAHELGHIIIPWHVGTIADIINFSPEELDELPAEYVSSALTDLGRYSQTEQEANRFASELLMPEQWVKTQIAQYYDLAQLHRVISETAGVSPLAASIRLKALLPPGIVYFCLESDVNVSFAGRTEGTIQRQLSRGELDLPDSYVQAIASYKWESGYNVYHWWRFPIEIALEISDPRPWKEILHSVITDVASQPEDVVQLKHVVNAVLAAAHGSVIKNALVTYSEDAIIAACIHRLHEREDLKEVARHVSIKQVIKKRAVEWYVVRSRQR